jgi:hypothetical protein
VESGAVISMSASKVGESNIHYHLPGSDARQRGDGSGRDGAVADFPMMMLIAKENSP